MFAPVPMAVGFTIVWPEGVIFRSMMTYHVQFLLLVLAGWVNRQQQDVIDYLQEENRVLRAGLGRFEHRLFLSATPHNGHSNSFSTLLELLDPYRFTRGVKVRGKRVLEDVMVRRLKEDIREVQGGFPKRNVERVAIDGIPENGCFRY